MKDYSRAEPKNKNSQRIQAACEYCGGMFWEKRSHYKRKKRHFCCTGCYAAYRRDVMPPEEQNTWRGGVSQTEAHRRWKRKNPERMAHLKARRYARERGAEGSHTLDEWQALKKQHGHRCTGCGKKKPLTKDHIMPLSENGSDYISNIQPMCRSCNSKKWKRIHENPELLDKK